LYDYAEKYPEFTDRKEALKQRPILKARQTVVKSLEDTNTAQWYLERKKKVEFSPRTEHTGADGAKLTIELIKYTDEDTLPL